jgi:hypothetical protein
MLTLAQLTRLETPIDVLAARMNPSPSPRVRYGSELNSDGNPVVRRPGIIVLDFGEQG